MKRTWLIGAALVFSLTAVGCSDDDESDDGTDVTTPDGGNKDSGTIDSGIIDSGLDSGIKADAGADAGKRD